MNGICCWCCGLPAIRYRRGSTNNTLFVYIQCWFCIHSTRQNNPPTATFVWIIFQLLCCFLSFIETLFWFIVCTLIVELSAYIGEYFIAYSRQNRQLDGKIAAVDDANNNNNALIQSFNGHMQMDQVLAGCVSKIFSSDGLNTEWKRWKINETQLLFIIGYVWLVVDFVAVAVAVALNVRKLPFKLRLLSDSSASTFVSFQFTLLCFFLI